MQEFMNAAERVRCEEWIQKYLKEMTKKQVDSYVLKHMFQHMTGIYASDAEFKDVMRECGFEPMEKTESIFNVKVDRVVIQNVYYKK